MPLCRSGTSLRAVGVASVQSETASPINCPFGVRSLKTPSSASGSNTGIERVAAVESTVAPMLPRVEGLLEAGRWPTVSLLLLRLLQLFWASNLRFPATTMIATSWFGRPAETRDHCAASRPGRTGKWARNINRKAIGTANSPCSNQNCLQHSCFRRSSGDTIAGSPPVEVARGAQVLGSFRPSPTTRRTPAERFASRVVQALRCATTHDFPGPDIAIPRSIAQEKLAPSSAYNRPRIGVPELVPHVRRKTSSGEMNRRALPHVCLSDKWKG
jgi:hypothetical protein